MVDRVALGGRFLGLVSTIVLARLLTPADFGIVTMATIIVGAVEVLGHTGQRQALMRLSAPTKEHYDTAWTTAMLTALVIAALAWLSAPVAVWLFHEPRAATAVHVVAIGTVISEFETFRTVELQRDFKFRALSVYNFIPSVLAFVVTLFSAIVLRNYWALAIGIVFEQASTVALGYLMYPHWPTFTLVKVREIWSYSWWALVRSVGYYLNTQVDKFAVATFGGAATMGRYEVATDVGTSPTSEINAPMIATLFPVMSKVQHDPQRRKELYLDVLYWSALICTSTAVGVALVTSDMVDLVLGPQWVDAKPLMPWLALAYGILGLSTSVYSAFDVIGQPRTSARLQWIRFGVLCVCVVPVAYFFRSARSIAIARFFVAVAITPTLFASLARALDLTLQDVTRTLWRPIGASLAMTAIVLGANALISFTGPARLLIDVSLGIATYTIAILGSWVVAGRPAGPEAALLNFFMKARA